MSNENQETIADIVVQLRAAAHIQNADSPRDVLKFAYHIEAAYNFEREAVCENSSHVGNAAAMREAVEAVVKVGYPHNFQKEAPHIRAYCYEITTAIKKCFAALSAPPRNCDVGTAEEQSARFDAHCRRHIGCFTCPLREKDGGVPKHYEFAWSQMPYEGGEK